MSLAAGLAALNLEMTDFVPRTEFSASFHPGLVKAVTGLELTGQTPPEEAERIGAAFVKAWDYSIQWSILVHGGYFGKYRVNMGHSEYAAGGVDRDDRKYCAFRTVEEVLSFDPAEKLFPVDVKAWVKNFEDHYKANCAMYPDAVNMTGTYVTCISGLLELFGWDLLLSTAGEDPEGFGEVANRYGQWMQPFYEALAESSVPVIMVHDDMVWAEGPFMHPEWYRKYVIPQYKRYFEPLRQAGKKLLFTSDGNYTMFLEDIAAAGANGFVLEPLTDLRYAVERFGKTHVLVGNVDTRVLLTGDREAIYGEVKRCMDTAKHCPGFIMAVGNHIPPNTPVDAALYYDEVYRKLARR